MRAATGARICGNDDWPQRRVVAEGQFVALADDTPQCFPLCARLFGPVHISRRFGGGGRPFPIRSPRLVESYRRCRNRILWACSSGMASDSISASRHSNSARNTPRQVPFLLARVGLRLWLDPVRRARVGRHADDGCNTRICVARNRSASRLFARFWNTVRSRGPQPQPFSHGLSEIAPALALGRAICRSYACQCRRPFVLRQTGRPCILSKSVQPPHMVRESNNRRRS